MKFVLKKQDSHTQPIQFWFTLVADNGEIVMTSEMYTRKDSAIDTMASINTFVQDIVNEGGCIVTDDQT